MAKGNNVASPAELLLGWNYTIFGDLLKPSHAPIPEEDPNLQLELNELRHDAYATILMREHAHGSKLESDFRKQGERILSESTHTFSLLPMVKSYST